MRSPHLGVAVLAGLLGLAPGAMAWSSDGHRLITSAAVDSLKVPELQWLPAEKDTVLRASVQPDWMRPRNLPQLRALEAPRHYLNLEVLEGRQLPEEYWQYVRLLTRIGGTQAFGGGRPPDRDVTQVGTLPYAILEGTQRLAVLLAGLRRSPTDHELRWMTAHQAGWLAHYAQDLCQPLHTTVHHDGRVGENGLSPNSGIHRQVDALIQSVLTPTGEAPGRPPRVLEPLFPAVVAALQESHSQVNRVYGLADELELLDSAARVDPRLVGLAADRFEKAVLLTADLIHTAWHLSAEVDWPDWALQPPPAVER